MITTQIYENEIQFRWLFISEKMLELYLFFNDGSKYYPQVFLDALLYRLAGLGINVDVWYKWCL